MSSIAYSLPRGSIAYSPTSGIVSRLPIREYEQGGLPAYRHITLITNASGLGKKNPATCVD